MSVYLCSDLHHDHKNICKYRTGFSTPEEHDEFICDKILSTCGKRDSLWILGDNFFTIDSLKYFYKYLKYIENINVVFGNHCVDSSERMKAARIVVSLCNKFAGLYKYKNTWLSHAPIHPDELRGKFNIHGHMHSSTIDDPRYFSVCLEQIDYTPIEFTVIKDIMKERNNA